MAESNFASAFFVGRLYDVYVDVESNRSVNRQTVVVVNYIFFVSNVIDVVIIPPEFFYRDTVFADRRFLPGLIYIKSIMTAGIFRRKRKI